MIRFAHVNGAVICHRFRPGRGRAVVFLNSLGTDHRIWDAVVARLPPDVPVLRMDKRGHGLSQTAPASVATYAADAAQLIALHAPGPALVCGVSIGGVIAQALALDRPELVAGAILSNTGARIGDAAGWQERLETLERTGLDGMASGVLERWFSAAYRRDHPDALEGWRAMLTRTPAEGYAIACRALGDADLRDRVADIDCPVLCLAGGADPATPPDLVRALAAAIPGAEYRAIDGVGHLPMIEAPDAVADAVTGMLDRLG